MRAFLISLLVLLCLPLMAFAQDDRDTLTAFLEDNLSTEGRTITVTGFRGAFSSRAEVDQLTIADGEGIWLTINDMVLDWNRLALVRGEVSINALTAAEMIIARAPVPVEGSAPAPEAGGFALPELPVSIAVGKLSAARIVMGAPVLGQEIIGALEASANLSGGEGQASLALTRTDDGPEGRIALQASYTNATRVLQIDLEAEEDSGGIASNLMGLPGTPSVLLAIKGTGPLEDFAANILLETDGAERLAGTVTLTGDGDGAQNFGAELGGDLAPLFLPDYAAFFGPDVKLSVQGQRSALGRLDLSALDVQTRALTLTGAAQIAADGLPQRVALVGRLGLASGEPLLLPISGEVKTRLNAADLRLNFDAAQGDGWSGAVVVTGLLRDDVTLGRAALSGSGRINRRNGLPGGAVLGGTFDFDLEGLGLADAALSEAIGQAVTGRAVLDWQPDGSGLRIGKLSVDGAGYGLQTSGRIGDLDSGFRLKGKVEARYDALSRLSALAGRPLSGSASFQASGEGSPLGGDFDGEARVSGVDIEIGQAELDRLLTGEAVIEVSAKRDASGTMIRQLDVAARQLIASLSGRVSSTDSALSGRVGFSDLSVMGPGYGGSLRAEARFEGAPTDGKLTLDGYTNALRIGQQQADALLAGQGRLAIALTLNGDRIEIARADVTNDQIIATASGHYAPLGSALAANVALPDLSPLGLGYRGGLRAELRANGTPEDGRLTLDGIGQNLAIGQAEADALLRGTSVVKAAVNIKNRRLEIEEAKITNPQVDASVSGTVTDQMRQVDLQARLSDMALLVPDFPGPLTVAGRAREDQNGYSVDLSGQGPGGIDAKVAGRIAPNFGSADLTMQGVAQAALGNAFLGNRAISGAAGFDLRLNGPLRLSSLNGRVTLSGGRFSDPSLPLGLQDMSVTGDLDGNQIRLNMEAASTTSGQVLVSGTVGVAAPNTADLQVGIRGLELTDPDLYQTRVDGAVTVQGPLTGGAMIAGAIDIGETELRVPSTGLGGGGTIDGLRHVNEPAPVRSTRARAGLIETEADGTGAAPARPFGLNLLIRAPSRIFLRGRGLDAELGGQITLRGTTDNVIPSGAFDLVRGRLDILGKRLDLTTAQLLMQGDLVPYVTIVASNESDGITTSVVIEGRADEPEVRFTSSPELPQEEVLARLLFGRGIDKISALQAAQLASAVATLAGKGGDGIVGNLRKGFGLDDLDLTTDAEGNTSVKAGKYISENVYTEIEVGQDGTSKINLNLDIRKGVTLRGSVGGDGAGGIGIFVEKDY